MTGPTLPAPAPSDPPWMAFARAELGVRELPGKPSNPRVEEYLRTTELHPDDEVPWCSAFVNWCVAQAGLKGTGRGAARSWLKWGAKAPEPTPFGAIVVLWREKPTGFKGHVGFFVREDAAQVWLLGGNQGNCVQVHAYPKFRVLDRRIAG